MSAAAPPLRIFLTAGQMARFGMRPGDIWEGAVVTQVRPIARTAAR